MHQESLRDLIKVASILGSTRSQQILKPKLSSNSSARYSAVDKFNQSRNYTITAQSLDTVDVYVNGIYDTGGLVKVVDGCRITFLHHDLDALKNKLRPEIRELRRPKWVQSLRRLLRQLLGIRL